jgi:hypothetical protein
VKDGKDSLVDCDLQGFFPELGEAALKNPESQSWRSRSAFGGGVLGGGSLALYKGGDRRDETV